MSVEAGIEGDLKVGMDVGDGGRVHGALMSLLSSSLVTMPLVLAITGGHAKRDSRPRRDRVDPNAG